MSHAAKADILAQTSKSRSRTAMSSRDPDSPLSTPNSQLSTLLLRGVDAGLVGTLFLVPLAMGGRSAIGQSALAILTFWTAACWCLRCLLTARPDWWWSWAEPVVLAAVGLVVLQIVPLPPNVVQFLSPHLYERLPLWAPGGEPAARLGVWNTLSLTPAATRSSLVVLASYGLLFLVALQRIRKIQDVERILKWIAVAGSAMAAFGLVQYVSGNGKYFWCYEYPFASSIAAVTGSFINRNHFAHFVVLAIGPLMWWTLFKLRVESWELRVDSREWRAKGRGSRVESPQLPTLNSQLPTPNSRLPFLLPAALLGLCLFAVLLSLSRGGAAAMFAATAVALLVLYRGSLIDGRTILFLFVAGSLVAASLGIYGYQMVSSRLEDFQSLDRLDAAAFVRRNLWRADLSAIADFRTAGTGAGSHCQVYPMYLPDNERTQHLEFVHAENGYLEVALEAGIPGCALVIALFGLCGSACLKSLRRNRSGRLLLCLAGVLPPLVASALHAVVDFAWYVPGCTVAVLLLAACACRLPRLASARGDAILGMAMPRAVWAAGLVGLGLVGYPMLKDSLFAARAEPSWGRFCVQSRQLVALERPAQLAALDSMARELAEVIRWQPDHAQAHARLAEVQLRLFDGSQDSAGPISARQLRHTVLASRFPSQEALRKWLARAFPGRHEHLEAAMRHARRAVALCPLQAEAYLGLAVVGFLDGERTIAADACIRQALKVRPFDGAVLLEAGQQSLLAGDIEGALNFWKQSFQCGSYHQERLYDLLAGQAPAEFFLKTFSMDLSAIQRLENRYRAQKQMDQVAALLEPRAQTASQEAARARPAEAVRLWLDAADARRQLADSYQQSGDAGAQSRQMAACLELLRNAERCDSANYQALLALARALIQTGQRKEALGKLEEILRWKRGDETARRLHDQLLTEELRTARRPTPGTAL